jgi:predicted phosphodiesterase
MTVSEDLLTELLTKPVGPQFQKRTAQPDDLTREIEVSSNSVTATLVDQPGAITEGTAYDFITEEGLDPEDWEIANWRKSRWGSPDNPFESVKISFKRVTSGTLDASVLVEDALTALSDHQPVQVRPEGDHGFLVLIGDMQFGKIDGDGPAGALQRTIECINTAADTLIMYRQIMEIGHVHVAWLGDHIEGFVSQGGANVWRTVLTLNEQIRLTHAVMLHAVKTFAPLAEKVTMVAVPGNHGEPVRFEGKGTTRYDDSHDTEALITIHNTIKSLDVPGFEHVGFYVPDTDELTVRTEVAGTRILHAHGHKFGSKKDAHLEWWKGQEFGREGLPAHLLVAGHLHHEFITENFIQVPAMESESTWFRHIKGDISTPGLIVAITKDGRTPIKHTINAQEGVSK